MTPDIDEEPAPPQTSKLHAMLLSLLVAMGYAGPPLMIAVLSMSAIHPALGVLSGIAAVVALIFLVAHGVKRVRSRGPGRMRGAADLLVLVLLPLWGLFYGFGLAQESCVEDGCGPGVFRPLAASHVAGLIALHVLVSLAYAASRRRSEALHPMAEVVLLSSMIVGIVVHATLAVHFGPWVFWGFVVAPVLFPCASPVVTMVLFSAELVRRLRLRGRDAALARAVPAKQPVYREGGEIPSAELAIDRRLLARALAFSPVLLGVHFALHALVYGRPAAGLEVLTRTCGYTLSQVPIEIVPGNCHYLCTVAARGHDWLVRPERIGVRGGVPILVNRQLAIANAFEDLLHERWPRFGRLARRIYDALGLPVSRLIRSRWLADAVYLTMKPAEWTFYLALLLVDRRPPEARIDRMYRPASEARPPQRG